MANRSVNTVMNIDLVSCLGVDTVTLTNQPESDWIGSDRIDLP